MADTGSPAQEEMEQVEGGAEGHRPLSASETEEQGVVSSLQQMQVGSTELDGGNAGSEESDMELGETSGGAALADRADPPTPPEQAGGMGYRWADEVTNEELGSHHSEADEDAASVLSDKGSESSRGRERRRGSSKGNSPPRLRAPPCERKPSERAIRQFLSDAFTRDALYPGLSHGGSLPEYVRFLPDERTGRPQHSYESDTHRVYPGAEPCHWLGQGPSDTRPSDKEPELRWEGVQHRTHNLGHTSYPRLLPGVSVPITSLPHDKTTRNSVQMLFIAWLQAGMRCPVKGCEPWAAVDAPHKALPQPQGMWTKSGRFTRLETDCSQMDPVLACGPASRTFRKNGMRGVESVVEHWQHFHMRKGKCFAAPCCSKTPAKDLGPQCQKRAFNSVPDAVEHMVTVHEREVKDRQAALQKEKEEKAAGWRKKKRPDQADVDPSDLRSVAQLLVHEMLEVYASRIGIPRTVGRGRWFTTALVTRVIIGHHLQFLDVDAQQWDQTHLDWLENCRLEYVKWTGEVPGYGVQPERKSGYDKAVKSGSRTSESRETSSRNPRRSETRVSGSLQPPAGALPQHRPIMEMLRRQYAVETPAAVQTTDEPAGPGKSSGEQPAATVRTATSSAVRPGDELVIAGAVCAAVEKRTTSSTSKTSSRDRESTSGKGSHSTTASKRERDRTGSRSPGSDRKRSARGGTHGLTAELRESEAKWQDRAVRAEEDLRRLQHRYNVLEKDQKSAKTRWESERTQLVADKSTAEAEASRLKTAADEADEECAKAYQQKEEAEARLATEVGLRVGLEAQVKPLRKEVKRLQKELTEMADELQTLRCDVNYVVPAGVLKLAYVPSYTEVLWASPGVPQPRQPVSSEERETAWRAVVETLRLQHKDVAAAWQFVEDQHKANPSADVFGDLYRATKMAVETISSVLVEQLGQHLASPRAGNSLATDLVGLPARSKAKIEVQEMTTVQNTEAAELRLRLATVEAELRESRALVEQKTKDVNTMHSYGTRHAECLRSLSRALQPMAEGLRERTRMQTSEEPDEVREARDLECQAQTLSETLVAVERRSHSISMVRWETKSQPVPKVQLSLLSAASLKKLASKPRQQESGSTPPGADFSSDEEEVRQSEEEALLRETTPPVTPNTRSSARRQRGAAAASGTATPKRDQPGVS